MSESDEEDGCDAFNDDTFGDGASTWEEESHEFLVARAHVEEDGIVVEEAPGKSELVAPRMPQKAPMEAMPNQIDEYLLMLEEGVSRGLKIGNIHQQPPPMNLRSSPFEHAPPPISLHSRPPPPPWNLISNERPQHRAQQQQRFNNGNNNGQHQYFNQSNNNNNNMMFNQHQPPPHHYPRQQTPYYPQRRNNHQRYHNPHHQNNNYYNNNNYGGGGGHHHHHRSEASYYNDRNRETFGDELVDAHQQTFREQNQRYFHHQNNNNTTNSHHNNYNQQNNSHNSNNNDDNSSNSLGKSSSQPLMTPDRVHANRVLNSSRHRSESSSTGDPGMDMRRNVRVMMCDEQKENDDYAGLMTATERQWVLQIQLSQLKCENPFVDDYYYTVFNQKKEMKALLPPPSKKQETLGINNNNNKQKGSVEPSSSSLGEEGGKGRGGSSSSIVPPPPAAAITANNDPQSEKGQLKRSEEGPQLLISEYSAAQDETHNYIPVQFDNSLGRLQAASVKAPRMAIQIESSNPEAQEGSATNAQKDSRKYKQILLELEHLFFLVIEVEDSEKKLAALPTNTSVRNTVETERREALAELRSRLSVEANVRRYILVRKGKTLLHRALRHLETLGVNCVLSILFALLPTALRRDREDQLLPELLPQLIEHFDSGPPSYIAHYLKLLNCGAGTSQSYLPTYRNILSSSSLGTTLLLLLVECLESQEEDSSSGDIHSELLSALRDTPIIVPPLKGYALGNEDEEDPSLDPTAYRQKMEKIFSNK